MLMYNVFFFFLLLPHFPLLRPYSYAILFFIHSISFIQFRSVLKKTLREWKNNTRKDEKTENSFNQFNQIYGYDLMNMVFFMFFRLYPEPTAVKEDLGRLAR